MCSQPNAGEGLLGKKEMVGKKCNEVADPLRQEAKDFKESMCNLTYDHLNIRYIYANL